MRHRGRRRHHRERVRTQPQDQGLQKDQVLNIPWVILHIPHASQAIPPELRHSLTLSDAQLHAETIRMTDRFTDELFAIEDTRVRAIVFPVSRLVVDPERFLDDEKELMAASGMGVVYTKTSEGLPLRAALSSEERVSCGKVLRTASRATSTPRGRPGRAAGDRTRSARTRAPTVFNGALSGDTDTPADNNQMDAHSNPYA